MPDDQDIVLPGVRMHYRQAGSRDAPPIIALHAAGLDATSWDGLAARLADQWQVFALDQRGHGRSGRTDRYSFELLRDDVVAFIDALDLDRPVVIGHSMGGTTAALLAEAHPERVRCLILEDTPPPRRTEPPLTFPEAAPPHLRLDPLAWTELMAQLADPDPRWWNDLARITAPTLIIAGGETSHVPQDELARACERIPNARLVTVEGAGHQVHTNRPDAFFDHLDGFLARHLTPHGR